MKELLDPKTNYHNELPANKIIDPSASSLSPCNEPELSHSPLIQGLPDDIALFCLARVPRNYHSLLKCVSKRWRDLVCSEEWWNYRQKNNLDESWIYAFCLDKFTQEVACYVLDPSCAGRGWWKPIPRVPPHCLKRKGMAFETVGKKLYLLGGCGWSADASDEVYCFDASTNTWSEVASMSTARCFFCCQSMHGKIYAISGYGLGMSDPYSWDTYDPCTNTWKSQSDPNIVLDVEDSVVMNGKIYARSRISTIAPHVRMSVYDPSSGKWQQGDADMASGWRGPAVVVDDTLYVLDQSLGTKLMMWQANTREWVAICRLSPLRTRPPCQMVAVGRNILIIGQGLSTVVLDVDNVGNADGVIATYSVPQFAFYGDVISCKCLSI